MSTDEQAMAAPEHEAPGQVLKARREAMGMSIEQIADQLKLAPRQVVALEAGDYENLPPAAVVRGFVRGYAKVLKLDATPLVAAIPVDAAAAAADASTTVRREKVASLPKVRYPSHGKRSRFPVGAVALAALAIAALAAAWHFGLLPTRGDAGAPASTTVVPPAVPGADGTVIEPVTVPMAPPVGNGTAPSDPALQQQSVPLISVPPAPADPSAPAAPAPAPANPPAGQTPPAATQNPPVTTHATMGTGTAATAAAAAPAAAGPNALVLNVKQDSWIEVRGSGRPLVSRLVRAGSTETVNVTEPVTLVVGNPAGVDATLRGAPLALPPLKGSTVSRQKLN